MELLHECKLTDGHFATGLKFFYDKENKRIKVITDKGREAEIVFDESIEDDNIVSPVDLYLEIKKVINEPSVDFYIFENSIKALEKIAKYSVYEHFYFLVNNESYKDLLCIGEVYDFPKANEDVEGRLVAKTTVGDFSIKVISDLEYLKDSIKKIPRSLSGGLTMREIYNVPEEDLKFFVTGYEVIFKNLYSVEKGD